MLGSTSPVPCSPWVTPPEPDVRFADPRAVRFRAVALGSLPFVSPGEGSLVPFRAAGVAGDGIHDTGTIHRRKRSGGGQYEID